MGVTDLLLHTSGALFAPGGARARLSILIYHRVLAAPDPLQPDIVDARAFETQMRALAAAFRVLPLDAAVEHLAQGTLPARTACITFDDGYRDNFEVAAPILGRLGLPATFFIASGYLDGGRMFNDTVIEAVRRRPAGRVELPHALEAAPRQGPTEVTLGDLASRRAAITPLLNAVKYLDPEVRVAWSAEFAAQAVYRLPDDLMMTRAQVRALSRVSGMNIGGHTVNHPILTCIAHEAAAREILDNRAELASLVEGPVTLFAYPNGAPFDDYAGEHVALVEGVGYRAAVSTAWGVSTRATDRFQLPRFTPWDRSPARFIARLLRNALHGGACASVPRPSTQAAT